MARANWPRLVDAAFDTVNDGPRRYEGRFHAGANPRIKTAEEAAAIVSACTVRPARSPSWTRASARSARQCCTTSRRCSATPTAASGSRHGGRWRPPSGCTRSKALTYPRTNSRYLTGDMVAEIKPTAKIVGEHKEYARASAYVQGLDVLPLGRVVNDAKVTDHHAIIPTRAEHHPIEKMNDDDRRIYDLVARRFLAVFHPDAVFENTRVETTVGNTCSAPAAS